MIEIGKRYKFVHTTEGKPIPRLVELSGMSATVQHSVGMSVIQDVPQEMFNAVFSNGQVEIVFEDELFEEEKING